MTQIVISIGAAMVMVMAGASIMLHAVRRRPLLLTLGIIAIIATVWIIITHLTF